MQTSRRNILKTIGAAAGLTTLPHLSFGYSLSNEYPKPLTSKDFLPCLNMSTIRGQNLGFVKELEVASKAGFTAVEIWMRTLQVYLDSGGTIKEAAKILKDLGLTVEDGMSFTQWVVDEEDTRAKAIETLKKEMDLLAVLGCKRIAAPPSGFNGKPGLNLDKAAERYAAILDIGDQTGVIPQLEIWGSSQNLSQLSEALYVAAKSGHPSAKILLDVYHLYRGGTSVDALRIIRPETVELIHINDYPDAPRETLKDSDRVYPGDGVAPISTILKALQSPKRPLVLSFEVFNQEYYKQDALEVCKTGLAKINKVTQGL